MRYIKCQSNAEDLKVLVHSAPLLQIGVDSNFSYCGTLANDAIGVITYMEAYNTYSFYFHPSYYAMNEHAGITGTWSDVIRFIAAWCIFGHSITNKINKDRGY
jgi:hypothetical protein